MNADRIEWYANQLRGIQVADIPRKVRSILMDATNEARREERERVAQFVADRFDFTIVPTAIRAME